MFVVRVNVTVYATDYVGNIGVSETIIFTIAEPEPFPTTSFIAAVVTSMIVLGFCYSTSRSVRRIGSHEKSSPTNQPKMFRNV